MKRKLPFLVVFLAVFSSCTTTTTMPSTASGKTIPTVTLQSIRTSTSIATDTPDATEMPLESTEEVFSPLELTFPGLCESSSGSVMVSPDQNWLAQDCAYDTFQVIKRGGTKTWRVSYMEIFGNSEFYPQNVGGISPRHWTNDSQYIYFSVTHCCWDPFILMLAGNGTLYRMDIQDGSYSFIKQGAFDFSFSPTDRRVTFIQELNSPLIVEIYDQKLGNTQRVKLNVDNTYNQAKVDVWSSDGLMFVVTAVSGINYGHEVFNDDMFSIVIIDSHDLSQRLIVKDLPTSYLEVTEWTEDNVLIFKTGDEFLSEPIVFWQYDLNTDSLITPTPR
jgi:hypothetical protein